MWKILIVDSDSAFISRLKTMLSSIKLNVSVCAQTEDVHDAMHFIETLRPDIVITETALLQSTGLDLMRLCRKHFGEIPVFIIVTDRKDFSFVQAAVHYSAVEYLLKSDLNEELLSGAVRSAIERLEYMNVHRTVDEDPPEKLPDDNSKKNEAKNHTITEIQKYIQKNIDKKLSLNEVADVFGLSPNYLSSIFKKYSAYSFTKYINFLKIEEAKKLLTERNLKIYEISEKLGFEDAFYFSKVFKKVAGCSPKEYMQNLK